MINAPSARLRLVGSALRGYREASGCSLAAAAAIAETSTSSMCRIESGKLGIRPGDLRALLTNYGVCDAVRDALLALSGPRARGGWQEEFSGVLPGAYLDLLAAESGASEILAYAPVRVPPLLQTPEYARAAVGADASIPPEAGDMAATAVLVRQQALHERGTRLHVIIGEAALRQQAGTCAGHLEQVTRLAALAEDNPGLTLQILPLSAGPDPAAGAGEFTIAQFGDPAEFAFVHLAGPEAVPAPMTRRPWAPTGRRSPDWATALSP